MGNELNKEVHIKGNVHSISQWEMQKIINQMNKCICKIICNNSFGTGFFCKIPISDNNQNHVVALITCYHVLEDQIKGGFIKLIINQISHNLLIDKNRKVFIDKERDIVIIIIKKGEFPNIEPFYLDENIFYENPENIYEDIYILHFELGREAKYSSGIIANFKKTLYGTKLLYSCSTEPGSSGGPLINPKNFNVIGLHNGYNEKKLLNQGTLISDAIIKFKKWYIKNKDYNDNNFEYNNNEQNNNNINKKYEPQNYNNIHYINQINNGNINMNMNNMNDMNMNNMNDMNVNIMNDMNMNMNNMNNMNNINMNDMNMNNLNNININNMNNMNDMNMNNMNMNNMNNLNNIMNNKINNNNNNYNNINNIYNNNNININNLDEINEIHEHPLILSIQNDKLCNICLQSLNNTLAHKCNSCLFIICQNCISNIFKGKINIKLHPHKLKLKFHNHEWTCIECQCLYMKDKCISFYCDQCNQNFCDFCYLSENNEQVQNNNEEEEEEKESHEHSLKYTILNDICMFCCNNIFNKMGYKCEGCDLVLCENCYEKIYINDDNENHNLHKHTLALTFRNDWFCNLCKQYYKNKYSYCCKDCNFDVCYKCYYNPDNKNKNNKEELLFEYFNKVEKAGKIMDDCITQ